MSTVYRIQGPDGRGPWQPGLPQYWLDLYRPEWQFLKPFYEEFPNWRKLEAKAARKGYVFFGSGCLSPEQLRLWISQSEYVRLRLLGFQAVKLPNCKILAKSDTQCLFTRRKPLYQDAEPFELY